MESELDSEITGTDYSSTESDSDDNTAVSPTHSRKRQRMTLRQNYTSGASRNAYRFSKNLDTSLSSVNDNSGAELQGVCRMCSHGLSVLAEGFHQLKHRGIELRKRKRKLPNRKHPNCPYYRNLVLQNE